MRSRSEIAALLVALTLFTGVAHADDPMTEFRDRFAKGMAHYKAGRVTEAVGFWEPIYRELGPEKGYRLAFNLGVAYDALTDATRAAERFEAFLAEVEARRTRGETIEPLVAKEEKEAKEKLAHVASTHGRIRVKAGRDPIAAQIDAGEPRLAGYLVYVKPGAHTVTFAPGAKEAEKKDVTVAAGELVEVAPTPPPPPVEPPKPKPVDKVEPPPDLVKPKPPPPKPPPRVVVTREPPFPAAVVFVGAGISLATVIVPVLTYGEAASQREAALTISDPQKQGEAQAAYDSQRALAYATLVIPIALGTITAGLAIAYFAGTKEKQTLLDASALRFRF
jgi:hypothetical protein